MKEKDYQEWTREEFEKLPYPESFHNDIGEVDYLIILPTGNKHSSGFRCMEFVTIQNGKPTYRISGCSDIIHFGGIGGYNSFMAGDKYSERVKTKQVYTPWWRIDCLRVSGLLRVFCEKQLVVGTSCSDFELFFKED